MNKVSLTLTGVKEIDEVFDKLPRLFQDRVLQSAHASAAKPLIAKAQSIVAKDKGGLSRSIGVQKGGKGREVGTIKVGPRRGKHKGHHGHLIEYGYTRKTGKNEDGEKVNARPFMEPAFQATKGQLINLSAAQYAKPIVNLMRRTLKK